MKKYIKLIRPHHYIKNALLFFPLIFSGHLFDIPQLCSLIYGFFSFSLISSVVYIINDINDADKLEKLAAYIKTQIKQTLLISAKVELLPPKSIARSEGKAKRITDNRNTGF